MSNEYNVKKFRMLDYLKDLYNETDYKVRCANAEKISMMEREEYEI